MFKKTSSRSGLFLLELIISILFFSMASAVCIRLFVQAHVMDRENRNLTQSVKLCENLAEIYTACEGDLDALCGIYPYFQRDLRSIEIEPSRDFVSSYRLEESIVSRIVLRSSSVPESDAPASDAASDSTASGASLAMPAYTVQDMLMFLDQDWQPGMFPQSGGYVLCVIFFEQPLSAGSLRHAVFGVWEYDTMQKAEVDGLEALTGIVTDDYFSQFSCLSEEDVIYSLDVTIYVPDQGGDGE